MESSSNSDEEPKVCTLFSSASSENPNKSVFDTIAFSVSKKESVTELLKTNDLPQSNQQPLLIPDTNLTKSSSMVSMLADDLQSGDHASAKTSPNLTQKQSHEDIQVQSDSDILINFNDLTISSPSSTQDSLNNERTTKVESEIKEELPPAKIIFENVPEVDFPVNISAPPPTAFNSFSKISELPQKYESIFEPEPPKLFTPNLVSSPISSFSASYVSENECYDKWIIPDETIKILEEVKLGTYVPDKDHMTMPGVLLEEDLVDKVGLNVEKIFGVAERSRRRVLTADHVSQDDNGLKELIKLGCYRSAINLTKRLLGFYGQGLGREGQFSKHSPHSLQLWFTRISLLVRIREFGYAESELEKFKKFKNPDLFYEYYPDSFGGSKSGSMVPFHFRLLAGEIPQYMRKFNDTRNDLHEILTNVQTILLEIKESTTLSESEKAMSLDIWCKRRLRVLYSLTNSSLLSKDYYNAFNFLNKLHEEDVSNRAQISSSIARLFLNYGDVQSAEIYFTQAAEERSKVEGVEFLLDSALIAISQNQYGNAMDLYKKALEIEPENLMIHNNIAVCLLYLGRVKESSIVLETAMINNVPSSLQENLILNLSSIYELENSDGSKKHQLLKLISEYKGDGINLASLKLQNLL